MKTGVHREKLMFTWNTNNHEIKVGIKKVLQGKCKICGKPIKKGNTICDECFKKEKEISKK